MSSEMVAVTPEDREAAALIMISREAEDDVRAGRGDRNPIVQAFARHRQQAEARATSGAGEDTLTKHVAEVMAEDGGCWMACSGCQESDEGYVSEKYYPFSPIFRCQPGGGCSECGGIGVLWEDGAFLASYGDFFLSHAEAGGAEGWKLVPVELTPEMVTAWEGAEPEGGWAGMPRLGDEEANQRLAQAEWSAMLAAVPASPTEAPGSEGAGEVDRLRMVGSILAGALERIASRDWNSKPDAVAIADAALSAASARLALNEQEGG